MLANQNTNAEQIMLAGTKLLPIRETFESLMDREEEIGAALSIYHNGSSILYLWGGYQDIARQIPWTKHTMVSTFSACKAMVALCLLHLIDQGKALLDDPVVQNWPEFAAGGETKEQVTLRQLLNHSSGLPTTRINRPGDAFQWHKMVSALERSPLLTLPGEETAYHAVTFGHLIGEVIRRISGQMPSEYYQTHFAAPLGLDYTLKFHAKNAERTAQCDGYDLQSRINCALMTHVMPLLGGWKMQYFRPCSTHYHPNAAIWRSAEAPAVTGFGTANALARVYGMIANGGELEGVRVLSQSMISQIIGAKPSPVKEHAMGIDARIGLGMFFNLAPMADFGPNPNSFGHTGMGGTTSFCDPDLGMSFAYVCNHLYQPTRKSRSIIGERARELIDVTYACLAN